MASPICQVKDSAGTNVYTSTTNGFNTTPSAGTTTINLVSGAGVASWSIACVGTDENTSPATINAGLTIDGTLKTCAFTPPAAGSALVFLSTVTDVNNVTSSTTFGVFTLWFGRRTGAVGESSEGSAAYGWVVKNNQIVRGDVAMSLLADFASTTSTSAQNTNLTFPFGASDIWIVEFGGQWSLASGASGVKLAVSAPGSATLNGGIWGDLAALTTGTSSLITSTALSSAFNTVAATLEPFEGYCRIKGDGVTAGSVTLQIAPAAAVVATVKAGAWLRARRVVEV